MNVSKLYFTIFSICSILGTGGCQPPQPAPSLTQRTSIADREKWKASDFFEDSRQRELCEAISDGDTNLLMRLLDSDASLNEPGKYGVTVLYWAYLEDDFGAFKSLLERGADPDRRLEANIPSRHFQFAKEDSVLFSSLRHLYGKYCVAALKYSHDVNQRDRVGNNLLNVYLWPGADVTERDLQELVDSGINLNAKGESGCPPCQLVSRKPRYCIQLLEAGADPSIKNAQGKDLADVVEAEFASLARSGREDEDDIDSLVTWLSKHYRNIRRPEPSVPNTPSD